MDGQDYNVQVTVICITYNHEKYIRAALEGFVSQKTTFPFEVIIHDDASNDKTADIIREYAEKYRFVHPIFEKENQYSKGTNFSQKYIYPLVKGKYIAYCEGDDYWTDENKLQIMYDIMEAHAEYSMCCHAYTNIRANTGKVLGEVHTCPGNGFITVDQAIMYKDPSQLCAQMFRRETVLNMPEIYRGRGVGDYPMYIHATTSGAVYYIDQVMSKHRIAADGSWTKQVYKDREKRAEHDKRMIDFLRSFDKYLDYRYHNTVLKRIDEYRFDICFSDSRFSEMRKFDRYNCLSIFRKIIISIGCLFPRVANAIFNYYDFR